MQTWRFVMMQIDSVPLVAVTFAMTRSEGGSERNANVDGPIETGYPTRRSWSRVIIIIIILSFADRCTIHSGRAYILYCIA